MNFNIFNILMVYTCPMLSVRVSRFSHIFPSDAHLCQHFCVGSIIFSVYSVCAIIIGRISHPLISSSGRFPHGSTHGAAVLSHIIVENLVVERGFSGIMIYCKISCYFWFMSALHCGCSKFVRLFGPIGDRYCEMSSSKFHN